MERVTRNGAAVALAAVLLSGAAGAQVARSGGGNANAQVLQQMQQLASERTALQAENEHLKTELADMKKYRDSLKTGQQALDRRAKESAAALAHSNAERDSSAQELAQTKAKMQELIAKFRETIQKLRETETESATARQTLAARDRELAVCKDHNAALYTLDDQVLTYLEKQGVWSRLARAEPFTRIKRNELENYVDESRTKAQEQLIAPSKSSSPPPKTEATPPAAPSPPDVH